MGANKLHLETSPYLLQHKDNTVHWQAWGDDSLSEARRAEKPILLSVGYAACHWCHVMAHESFENVEIATFLNDNFVSIKVDREERPDLDMIYQSALAMLGEHGGWPLTMFLTPNGEPFWGGTYFPPEPRYGRPGFLDVLQSVASVYKSEPDRITKNVEALRRGLIALSTSKAGEGLGPDTMNNIAGRLVREFDPFHGGLGSAPKFPQPMLIEQLWRAWRRTGQDPFLHAVRLTLNQMCLGGIYDHVGGGFARYAVDDRWLIPHFEKMLYDNALLIELLTEVWRETRCPLFSARVHETVEWVIREMLMDEGGFASSVDADSEGKEGKFYVWDEAEINKLLGNRATLFKGYYDVTENGNWEGTVILNRLEEKKLDENMTEAVLRECLDLLFEAREERVPPDRDDKVLADWNGLMISALANAASTFERKDWLGVAKRAFSFVASNMTDGERLMHSYRAGHVRHPATLDDYANLCRAALTLFEITGETEYRMQAESWVEKVQEHYADPIGGGYFFAADDTKHLITRPKSVTDNAVPSGNGTLVGVMARLYNFTGEDKFRIRGKEIIEAFSGELETNTVSLSTLINNAELFFNALQIVIIGQRSESVTIAMIETVCVLSLPNRILQVIDPETVLPTSHPAHGKTQVSGMVTAYVCNGPVCSAPFTDLGLLATELKK